MNPPVDTASFQLGAIPDEEEGDTLEGEEQRLRLDRDRARAFIESFPWAPPITEMLLAYGPFGLISLFLVRFSRPLEGPGEGEGDSELWVAVGDLPSIYFSTTAQTPARALELYCLIAEDWASAVLAGEDISDCFPIPVEPTIEHAEMLKRRTGMVRQLIPEVGNPDNIAARPL